MATMQEIAKLAGVSRGTVDRVLNNRDGVNEETKKKVLEIADLVDYQPNKAGIALATQKKNIKIGILLYGEGNPFFEDLKTGISERYNDLSFYGFTYILKQSKSHVRDQIIALDEMLKEDINGLIISPFNDPRIVEKINELTDKGIFVVTVNTDLPDSKRIAYVGSDDYKSGQTAGGLMGLLTKGVGEIGIITGGHNVTGHENRIQGFEEVISKKYPKLQIVAIEECQDDDYKAYGALQRMLLEHPTITAIFFSAGGIYGGCKFLYQMTQKQPYTVITYDMSDVNIDFLNKDIITATIGQDPYRQGSIALSVLIDKLILGQDPEESRILTDINIKIKESL
ncbi:MAG: LacI family DNA-binding transcriptional regulator [Lachnospiraceae bacterium]|nr:LacI family DNA-binding transcriptional regulator [Lachnospiraceae bacterium]